MGAQLRALVAGWLVLATTVSAQSSSASVAAPFQSSSPPKVIEVTINKGSTHRFDPEEIVANIGDIISFQFFPTNHSVVKAEYGFPCVPYDYVESGSKDMFFSGNRLLAAADETPIWNLTVNSTEPVFFYCSALESCNGEGMIGAINPNKTMNVTYQRSLALEPNTIQLSPGDPIPLEASSTMVHSSTPAPSSSSSATSATATATPTASAASSEHPEHHSALSGGAIAGIAIGGVAAILICGLLFFYMGRTKSLKEAMNRNSATVQTGQGPHDPSYPGYGFVAQSPPSDYRQSSNYRDSHQLGLPPYGSPYSDGPRSEAPGSPGFAHAEMIQRRSEMASPRPEDDHKDGGAPTSPKVVQTAPAELA